MSRRQAAVITGLGLFALGLQNLWLAHRLDPAHGHDVGAEPSPRSSQPPPSQPPRPPLSPPPLHAPRRPAGPTATAAASATPANASTWSGLYQCVDPGETFSASFLATVAALNDVHNYGRPLSSHRAAHACHYVAYKREAYKTVDAFDFFVEHFSAYERRLNLGKLNRGVRDKFRGHVEDALRQRLAAYSAALHYGKAAAVSPPPPPPPLRDGNEASPGRRAPPSSRTLAMIPYYGEGAGRGQAQSSLNTRQIYLKATFWSVRAITDRVVIAVCTADDGEPLVLGRRRLRTLLLAIMPPSRSLAHVQLIPPPSSPTQRTCFCGLRNQARQRARHAPARPRAPLRPTRHDAAPVAAVAAGRGRRLFPPNAVQPHELYRWPSAPPVAPTLGAAAARDSRARSHPQDVRTSA